MATLTYDPTPADQPELRESEVEALKIGQEQADAEGQLLAGNFKTTEDLERAYIELRKEFSSRGSQQEEVQEEEEGEEEEGEEEEEDESSETLTEEQAEQLQNMVGGEQAYNDMLNWAGQNISQADCDLFDSVVGKGDPNSCLFAIQALNAKYQEAVGKDGRLLTGKGAVDKQDVFRSQQEVVQAMSDPRYEKDPAFRNDVYAKLERSNIAY
jgi:methionine synthase II (cobalamin-independent)